MRKNPMLKKIVLLLALLLLAVLYFFGHNVGLQGLLLQEGLMQLAGVGMDILSVGGLALISGGAGRTLLQRLPLDTLYPAERIAIESAFGLGVIAIGALVMGLVGFYSGLMWVALALVALLTIPNLIRWVRDMRDVIAGALQPDSTWSRLLLLIIVVLLTGGLLLALAPPTAWDSLTYHMEIPHYYLDAGGIVANPDNYYFGLPQSLDVLFGIPMALFGRDTAAAPLHWYTGVLAMLAIGGFLRRHTDKATAYFSGVIVLSSYSTWLIFGWSYVDLAMLLYGAAGLIALLRWSDSKADGWLMLAAAFGGLAFSTKYSGGVLLVAIGIFVLIKQPRRVIQNGLLVTAIVLVLYAPWGLRAFLHFENPIYPYVFGGLNWGGVRSDLFSSSGINNAQLAWMIPTLPLSATLFGIEGRSPFLFTVGPLMLTLPFLLLLTRQALPDTLRPVVRDVALIGVIVLVTWMLLAAFMGVGARSRQLLIAAPVAAVLGSLGIYGLSLWPRRPLNMSFVTRVMLVLVLLLASFDYAYQWANTRATEYFSNAITRDDYLTHNLPLNYPAMQQLDTLPDGSTVRFMWEPRYHHCPDDIICLGDLIFDNWAYPIASGTDPDDLMQQWREGDTDYILFGNLEEGAQGFGYTFWLEQHETIYDINVLFPAYLEAYMQPIWTDGLGFTLYEWKENPSAPLNLPDTTPPANSDTDESN